MDSTLQAAIDDAVSRVMASAQAAFPRQMTSDGFGLVLRNPTDTSMLTDEFPRYEETEDNHLIRAYDKAISLFTDECRRQRTKVCVRLNASIPFHQLPPELLGDILALAVVEESWVKDLTRLTAVSSFWRQLVESTPRFWTYIENVYDPEIAKMFISRSQCAPLTISFTHPNRDLPTKFDNFVGSIVQHCDRFESLVLQPWLPTKLGLQLFRQGPFPHLKRLSIREYKPLAPVFLPVAPSLRSLCLNQVEMDWALPPSPTLSHLELAWIHNPPPVHTFLAFLSALPILEKISLGWEGTAQVDEGPHDPIHLAHLHTIVMGKSGLVPRAIANAMLTKIEGATYRRLDLSNVPLDVLHAGAPALDEIWGNCNYVEVETHYYSGPPTVNITTHPITGQSVLSLTTKSGSAQLLSQLEETLSWVSLSSPSAAIKLRVGRCGRLPPFIHFGQIDPLIVPASTLQACPRLTSLELGDNVKMDDGFAYLAEPKQDDANNWSWPCPGLEEIDISAWKGFVDGLSKLIQSRWRVSNDPEGTIPRKRLKRFILPPRVKSEVMDALKDGADTYIQ